MVFTTRGDDGEGEGLERTVRDGEGGTRWCLECGSEWVDQLDECPDCDLPLVDENPFVELPPATDDAAHIEYELDEWAAESRVMLDQLLVGASIPHAWEGGRLVVPEAVEQDVDALVEQVEVTTLPTLDPDAEKVAFTLDEWRDDQYEALMAELDDQAIPYEFDINHDLIVLAEDGDRVEALLDAVEFPDALAVDDEGGDRSAELPEGDGDGDAAAIDEGHDIDPDAVLGGLFVGCDRLVHDARDHKGVIAVAEHAADVLGARAPYGFPPAPWAAIRQGAQHILDLLESDTATDDEVQEAATELRATLRPYV